MHGSAISKLLFQACVSFYLSAYSRFKKKVLDLAIVNIYYDSPTYTKITKSVRASFMDKVSSIDCVMV